MEVTGASCSMWFSLILLYGAPCAFCLVPSTFLRKCFIRRELNKDTSFFSEEVCRLHRTFVILSIQKKSYPPFAWLKLRTNDKHVRYNKQLNLILRQSNLMSFNSAWISCLSSFFSFPALHRKSWRREKKSPVSQVRKTMCDFVDASIRLCRRNSLERYNESCSKETAYGKQGSDDGDMHFEC